MSNRTEYIDDITLLSINFYSSDSDESIDEYVMNEEEWMDWNSEHLLNIYMSCVEHYENEFLIFRNTFNSFCHFVYSQQYVNTENEYISTGNHLEDLYDDIVNYCQMHNTFLFRGVSFESFKNFIST